MDDQWPDASDDDDTPPHLAIPALPDEDQVFALALAGVTPEQISVLMKVPVQSVRQAITTELESRRPNTPEEVSIELERLTALWRVVYGKAVAGDLDAAKAAAKIVDYRTKLVGNGRKSLIEVPVNPKPGTAIRDAWTILAVNAPLVAESMVDIAVNGKSESARVAAGLGIFDRVGITKTEQVTVHVTNAMGGVDEDEPDTEVIDPMAIVKNRLKAIADRRHAVDELFDPPAAIVVDDAAYIEESE